MGCDGLGHGIVVGGDDAGRGLRGMLECGLPLVVVGLVDGAAEGDAGALEGADVVGGPDEDFALGRELLERPGVGLLEGDAGAGILNGLARGREAWSGGAGRSRPG